MPDGATMGEVYAQPRHPGGDRLRARDPRPDGRRPGLPRRAAGQLRSARPSGATDRRCARTGWRSPGTTIPTRSCGASAPPRSGCGPSLAASRSTSTTRTRTTSRTPGPARVGLAAHRPGRIVAHRDGAVLVATGAGGAVWIGHAKVKPADSGRGLKLPAVHAVRAPADRRRRERPASRSPARPARHPPGHPVPPRGPGGMDPRRALQRRRLDGVLWTAAGRAAVRRRPGHHRDRPGRRQGGLQQRDPPRGHRGRR